VKTTALTFFFLLFFVQELACQPPVVIGSGMGSQDVGHEAWVLKDDSGKLGIDDILGPDYQAKFTRSQLQVPNFNSTNAAAWLRLKVVVPPGQRYFLEIGYPLLYELDFYLVRQNQVHKMVKNGTSQPFAERTIATPNFYFELEPQCDTYYIRATSYEILQLPLKVGPMEDLLGQALTLTMLNGMYLGFVVLIILYNLFLYLSTRERIYGTYVMYVVAVGLVTANLLGLNFQYLYPNAPWLNFYTPIFYPLNFFVLIFSMDFLGVRQRAPQYRKGFIGLIGICVAEILLNLAGFPHLMFQISQGVGLLVVAYILFVAGKVYRQGYRPAKFFLLAFMTFLAGIVITILLSSGVIPYSVLAYHSIQIGSAIEIVLLSFAIADKINIYKREKDEAQLLALRQAEENRRLVVQQKADLEVKVRERTQEIERQKEEMLAQNEKMAQTQELAHQNEKLVEYSDLLNAISMDLQVANANLEAQVEERTRSLSEANTQLVKQNQQLEEYAYVTSHHLRAPVARLLGLASLFDRGPLGNDLNADLLEKLVGETRDLDGIIRDLNLMLDVQKQSAGPYETVHLATQANLALQKLEAEVADSQAKISLDFAELGELWSVAAYLEQIIYLLISNAIKFRDPARPLHIEVGAKKINREEILLTVRDNGLGINLHYAKDKLFGLYQRFHPDIPGKGMGLFLLKTKVEHLGGQVEVDSRVNQGATFNIYLKNSPA
jgi:two-component system, sensor histidine kinase LadS